MNKYFRTSLFGFAVLVSLVVSAVHPMTVRADDGTPSAPAAPASEGTSTDTNSTQPSQAPAADDTQAPASEDTSVAPAGSPAASTDTPVPPVSTPVPATDPASTDTSPAPTDTPAAPANTEAAPASTTDSPSATDPTTGLSQVPSGTPVVVLDATGTPVPLATQAAADIIQTADPIWCPNGVAPIAGQGGCTGSYSDLLSLINSEELATVTMPEGKQGGTIWIEKGTDASDHSISINGSILTNLQAFTLTLQGGWDGASDGLLGGTNNSEFDGNSISVLNWENDVTVNDLYIHNDIPLEGAGLVVQTTGNISVQHVRSNQNEYSGAILNNTGGDGSSITVGSDAAGDSEFNGNGRNGLVAYSNGNITLNSITADSNTFAGIEAMNRSEDDSAGIILTNSHADGNSGYGAFLKNSGSGITVTSSTFNDNTLNPDEEANGSGLIAYSFINVTLNAVTADNNDGDGANLVTQYADVSNSHFDGNHSDGLAAFSPDVTLSNVSANHNGRNGAILGAPDPTITNSQFDGNGGDGLLILTEGDATVICSTADNNHGFGINGFVGGTFTLEGVGLNGNVLGDNNVTGDSPFVITPGNCRHAGTTLRQLPWNIVNVQDGGEQSQALDCSQHSGTEMVLPNGDHVLVPCPIGSVPGTSGSLHGLTNGKLPGQLDGKFTFVSALHMDVTPAPSSGVLTVGFKIPSGQQGSNFAILYWDGTKWVNLGGSINPPGYFSVQTGLTGDFILVTQ